MARQLSKGLDIQALGQDECWAMIPRGRGRGGGYGMSCLLWMFFCPEQDSEQM